MHFNVFFFNANIDNKLQLKLNTYKTLIIFINQLFRLIVMSFRPENFNLIPLATMIIILCLFNLINRFLFDVICRMVFESMIQFLRTFFVFIETFNAFLNSKVMNVKSLFETFLSISAVFAKSPSAVLFFSAFFLTHFLFSSMFNH